MREFDDARQVLVPLTLSTSRGLFFFALGVIVLGTFIAYIMCVSIEPTIQEIASNAAEPIMFHFVDEISWILFGAMSLIGFIPMVFIILYFKRHSMLFRQQEDVS